MSRALSSRLMHSVFSKVNQKRAWYDLPTTSLKALNLLSLRLDLRDMNLFDTGTPIRKQGLEDPPPEALTARRPDGKWNDLNDPEMGSSDTAFTRNVNPKRITPEKAPRLFDPSPRTVSLELMTRDTFKPAVNLNVLARRGSSSRTTTGSSMGRGNPDEVLEVPLGDDDEWPEHPMRVRRTVPFPPHPSGGSNARMAEWLESRDRLRNTETHWWDGSQIYGAIKSGRTRCARSATESSSSTTTAGCSRTRPGPASTSPA